MLNIEIKLNANGKKYALPLSEEAWEEIREVLDIDEDDFVEDDEFDVYADCDLDRYMYRENLQELEEIQKAAKDIEPELLAAILDSGVKYDRRPLTREVMAAIEAVKAGQFFFDKVTPAEYAKGRYEIANDVPMGCEEEFKAYNGDYQKMFDEQYAHECVVINDGVLYGPALNENL